MNKTLYMKVSDQDIGKYVIFSGDPWRVEVIKDFLDEPKKIAFEREYNTYTGFYKGVKVTISSTGIGAPSAAIAMEEMYEAGMRVALRMGTVMSLKDDLLGHYIVPIGSMRRESTSLTYATLAYPAIADLALVEVINETLHNHGQTVDNGLSCSMDGFYTQMRDSRLSKERNINIHQTFEDLKDLKISGIDMESSCMLVCGRLMNVQTASLTLVTVLENLKAVLPDGERQAKEKELCMLALESIYNLAQKEKQR